MSGTDLLVMGFSRLVWFMVPNRASGQASRDQTLFSPMVLLGQRNAVVTAEGHLKYSPRDAERKAGVAVVHAMSCELVLIGNMHSRRNIKTIAIMTL